MVVSPCVRSDREGTPKDNPAPTDQVGQFVTKNSFNLIQRYFLKHSDDLSMDDQDDQACALPGSLKEQTKKAKSEEAQAVALKNMG